MISNSLASKSKLSSELLAVNSELASLLVGSNNGIVQGLQVSVVGNTMQVASGSVVIDGSYYEFSSIIDGISVNLVAGERGFLVVRKSEVEESGLDPYGKERTTATNIECQVTTTNSVLETDVILAHYEVVLRNSEKGDDGDSLLLMSDTLNQTVLAVVPPLAPYLVPTHFDHITAVSVTAYGNTTYLMVQANSDPASGQFVVDKATGILRFNSADAGLNISIDSNSMKPNQVLQIVVDTSSEHLESVRQAFTMRDIRHCNNTNIVGNNVHGTTFDDLNQEFPLHSQIFDTGFSVTTTTDRDGIPGRMYVETYKPYAYAVGLVTRHRFQIDMFGNITGVVGNQYLRLRYTPIVVSYVVDKTTRSPIAFKIVANNIVFPKSSEFDAPMVEVGYTAIAHLDADVVGDNAIVFNGGSEMVIISEGHEIFCRDDMRVDFGDYKDIPGTITVAVDSKESPVLTPSVLDHATLSEKSSSNFQGAVSIGSQAQIALTLRNSPLSNALKPPAGRLTVVTSPSGFFGRRRFIYTYSKENRRLYVVTSSGDIPSDYNLSGAHLYRNDELIDRDSWKFTDDSRTKIVITNATYESVVGPIFKLMSGGATSSRNRRGYTEFVGLAEAPVGPKAKCIVTSIGQLSDGDTVTLQLSDRTITKVFRTGGKYFSGSSIADIALSVVQSLTQEPLVLASGIGVGLNAEGDIVLTTTNALASLNVFSTNAAFMLSQFEDNGSGIRQAVLKIVAVDFVDGDGFTLSVDGQSSPIRRSWYGKNGFSFDTNTLTSIYQAFISDEQFDSSDASMTLVADTLSITSSDVGASGNSNTFYTSGTALSISGFSGGLDNATPKFSDIAGLILEIADEQQFDSSGVFHIYCTDNLDEGASETEYFHVCDIPQVVDGFYQVVLNSSDFDTNIIDTSSELSLDVIITGRNASGSSEVETISINPTNFCEYFDESNGIENELRFVRSKNLYTEITQWAIASSSNVGSSELVVLSQSTSGARDLFELAEVSWNGKSIVTKRDLRKFISSTTFSDGSYYSGEALSTMATLFGGLI